MRKTSILITASLALLLLTGCQNDRQPEQHTFCAGKTYTIQTDLHSDGGLGAPRRVHAGASESGKTPLLWSVNDQIYMVMPNGRTFNRATFTLSSGANTSNGSFTGTAPASADYYYVLYPGGDGKTVYLNGSQIVLSGYSIPQNQTGVDVFSLLPMAGYGTGNTFQMTNLGCVLKLKLFNSSACDRAISEVMVRSTTSGQYLAGTYNYNLVSTADGILAAARQNPGTGYDNVYRGVASNALPTTADNAEEFSFVLAGPVNTTIELSATVVTPGKPDSIFTKSFSKELSIAMGEIKTIAPSAGAFDIDGWTKTEKQQ